MLESTIQKKIISKLKKNGWYVNKVILCNNPGHPDIEAYKDNRAIFIEVKQPGCKPTELQLYRHRELRKQGFEVYVMTSDKDLKNIIQIR